MTAGGPNGFAIVDKEAGWTSHDVVARARKLLDTRKVGHSGTLDPSATGVLILGVGRGTKLLRFITELPKVYEADFQLGIETSTLDADGEVTATHDMSHVSLADVQQAALGFIGTIEQVPPMVSAVKIDGRRLHELAREGKTVERPARPVVVHDLSIGATAVADVLSMTLRCSSGTYVRTLAADIGAALGGGAHVRTLRRTAIGSFAESSAQPLEAMELISLADGLAERPVVVVDGPLQQAVQHGKVLEAEELGAVGPGPWCVHDHAGQLLALYQSHHGTTVKPAVVVSPSTLR